MGHAHAVCQGVRALGPAAPSADATAGKSPSAAVVAGASGQYLTGAALDATNNDFAPVLLTISAVQLAGLAAWWTWWDSSERVFE